MGFCQQHFLSEAFLISPNCFIKHGYCLTLQAKLSEEFSKANSRNVTGVTQMIPLSCFRSTQVFTDGRHFPDKCTYTHTYIFIPFIIYKPSSTTIHSLHSKKISRHYKNANKYQPTQANVSK